MITEAHWKNIEAANRQLASRFEKLKKARTNSNKHGIKMAEMDYFQALQHLYTTVEDRSREANTLKVRLIRGI